MAHGEHGGYPEDAQKLFKQADGTCKACDHTKVQGLVSNSLKNYWDKVHTFVNQEGNKAMYEHSRDWGEAWSNRDEISSGGTYSYRALANECVKFMAAHPDKGANDISSCRDAQAAKQAIQEQVREKFKDVNCAKCLADKYGFDEEVGKDLADSMDDIWKVIQAPDYATFVKQIIQRYCSANMKPMPCPPDLHSKEPCEGDGANCMKHALGALQGKQPVTMSICVGQINGKLETGDDGVPKIPDCGLHEVMMTAMGSAKLGGDKAPRCYVRVRNSWGTGRVNCPYNAIENTDDVNIFKTRCEADGSFLVPIEDLQKNLKDISYFGPQ